MSEQKKLFEQLKTLSTEQRNPASMDIDARSTQEILTIINNEDKKIALAVETQIAFITKAVDLVVASFRNGGRLIYLGAGTSGRLGVLDAAECPPTFGVSPDMVQGLIAGGERAMFKAQEGAEDKEENGSNDIAAKRVEENDVVCGIAASLRTPYVVGGGEESKGMRGKDPVCHNKSQIKA